MVVIRKMINKSLTNTDIMQLTQEIFVQNLNYGTSEGAIAGWETRKGGSGGETVDQRLENWKSNA